MKGIYLKYHIIKKKLTLLFNYHILHKIQYLRNKLITSIYVTMYQIKIKSVFKRKAIKTIVVFEGYIFTQGGAFVPNNDCPHSKLLQ